MPWQSSGNFNRLYSWVSDAAAGFDILADRMDADTNDITQGLMRTVNLDGLTSPSANLPMGGFKHTNVAPASSPTDYARFDQIVANTGNQTVNGNLSTTGTLTVAGGLTSGGLTVNGGGNVSGNLAVGQNLSVGNYAQLPTTLITAPATLNSTLSVAGGTTLNGAAALNGSARISGGATIDQLTVTGAVNVNGAASVAGGLTSGGLSVNGQATINGPLVATTSRIISLGSNAPSLTVYNSTAGAASCLWIGTGGLNFGQADGGGNPVAAWGYFDGSGNLNLDFALNVSGYAQANGGLRVQGGDLNVYGNAYKPGGGAWGDTASDVRLKQNITDYPAGLSAIRRLRPVSYQFNGRGDTTADGHTYYGLVAQDVVGVMPEMVGERPTERRGDPVRAYYTLDATPLIYAMVNALKEVVRRLEALEALEGVKGEIDADAAAPASRPGTANF
jgi:cytoskeletal protein CcmA (bactofilin family)